MNRPVVLIFIIAAIALLPMCCVFTGFLGGSNFMAWRVMESIDPNLGADAQKIKSEMSEFLDMHSKETYEEENKEESSSLPSLKDFLSASSRKSVRDDDSDTDSDDDDDYKPLFGRK